MVTAAHSVHRDAYQLAVDARDPRFDGVFYVGITTTRVYCRPVCPSRLANDSHRRFFASAAAAERAGFRPCLRCRPELAPGRAVLDAVSRLAQTAAQRIAAGALNGRSVAQLAAELGVSERHLRRAVARELGVAPLELARTHRLLLAKRLLVDSHLSITRIAYASGFQSLRRFNAAFRAQYGMTPRALRLGTAPHGRDGEALRLTLAYRAPFAWNALLAMLRREPLPGVEVFDGCRYGRTVRIDGVTGVVWVEDRAPDSHLSVNVAAPLVPVLMPLIAGLRRLFDLDAEPAIVDQHLAQGGLAGMVGRRPGVRIPGALDGFEVVLRFALAGEDSPGSVVTALGEPVKTDHARLTHLPPTAARVAEAGAGGLAALGVPSAQAVVLAALAQRVADGVLRLEPGRDVEATERALLEIDGMSEWLATVIVMHALSWPDALPSTDRRLQQAMGATSAAALIARAEEWRPWRSYATVALWAEDVDLPPSRSTSE